MQESQPYLLGKIKYHPEVLYFDLNAKGQGFVVVSFEGVGSIPHTWEDMFMNIVEAKCALQERLVIAYIVSALNLFYTTQSPIWCKPQEPLKFYIS